MIHRVPIAAPLAPIAPLAPLAFVVAACAGGVTSEPTERAIVPADVGLPPGYAIEAVARGLDYPTCVFVDEEDRVHVVEGGYAYGEDWSVPRILRVDGDGNLVEVVTGAGMENAARRSHWTGAVAVDGTFVIADGSGRILEVPRDGGSANVLVDGLPGGGDHHTNQPVLGPDGWIYFGQGTVTNSGVVGPDNADMGWLRREPTLNDVPGGDVVLAGQTFRSADPLTEGEAGDDDDAVATGAFQPFGVAGDAGQAVPGDVRCSGAVLRVRAHGRDVERVAWGLRNPFDLAFDGDGRLLATDNGPDRRGVRPIFGAADCLWHVEPGRWYGWPDWFAGEPATDPRFAGDGDPPGFLLAEHPQEPPRPLAKLGVHASANGIAIAPPGPFGHQGQAFVALFGDMAPNVGRIFGRVGFMVARVDLGNGVVEPFAVNAGDENGPASHVGSGGLERPIDLCFDRAGRALYVLDFGQLGIEEGKSVPVRGTGVLWRITRRGTEGT